MLPNRTLRFTRRNLPHWEVKAGRYFITVRCADSLHSEPAARLNEIKEPIVGGQGAVWQREWFDRPTRDDAGRDNCVASIQNNPVKAGLVPEWREHPWTR